LSHAFTCGDHHDIASERSSTTSGTKDEAECRVIEHISAVNVDYHGVTRGVCNQFDEVLVEPRNGG
jgi:hypothetical protein